MRHEEIFNKHKVFDKKELSVHYGGGTLNGGSSSLKRFSCAMHNLVEYVSSPLIEA